MCVAARNFIDLRVVVLAAEVILCRVGVSEERPPDAADRKVERSCACGEVDPRNGLRVGGQYVCLGLLLVAI